jgi:hypothetical protein
MSQKVVALTGADLEWLRKVLATDGYVYALRLTQVSNGQITFKVNQGTWTPLLGEVDPR